MPGQTKTNKASAAAKNSRVRKLTIKNKKKVVKAKKLPNSFTILAQALKHIWRHKRLYAGILAIFALLYVLLVKGLSTGFQLSQTRDAIEEAVEEGISTPIKAVVLLGTLFGTTGAASSEAASVYQVLLFIVISLVVIWTLRQTLYKQAKVTVKEAYYKSMYPFIPYILVWLVIVLQLIPALIVLFIYGIVTSGGIAVGVIEQVSWLLVLVLGLSASVYFVSSSLFASYIVTLPGMTPLAALRSARKLVRYRRWSVIRKVLFLPVVILISLVVIFFPLVLFAPVLAEILFLVAGLGLVLLTHSYMYVLYRALL